MLVTNETMFLCSLLLFAFSNQAIAQQTVTQETVTGGISNQYGIDGFELVGKLKATPTIQGDTQTGSNVDYDNYQQQIIDSTESGHENNLVAVRRTLDGLEYKAALSKESHNTRLLRGTNRLSSTKSTDSAAPTRDLMIVDEDDRTHINRRKATQFPYSTVSEIDYTHRKGGCSATLISRNSAITSAHCVFDKAKAGPNATGWLNVTTLSPGRYRMPNGTQVDPFGTWEIEAVTVSEEWMVDQHPFQDMAVITLKQPPSDNSCEIVYPGDAAGCMGLDLAANADLATLRVAGYPADKADGQMWDTGDDCVWDLWPSWAFHSCDTVAGMSGSAVQSIDHKVVGVHGYDFIGDSEMNGAVMLDETFVEAATQWAGIAHQESLPSADAVCLARKEVKTKTRPYSVSALLPKGFNIPFSNP